MMYIYKKCKQIYLVSILCPYFGDSYVYDDENDELPAYYLSGDFEYCLFVK